MDPPKKYKKIIIFAPTPVFLKRGDLPLDGALEEYEKMRQKNNFWRRNSILVETTSQRNPSELSRELSDMGYARHAPSGGGEMHKGEFMRQGGLITVFPINADDPLTIEFDGNVVAGIEEAALVSHKKIFSGLSKHKLEAGDYVVHEDHGIGIFQGEENGYFKIAYAPARSGGAPDTLSVPEKLSKKITPYLGLTRPQIHRLGTALWFKTRKKAIEDIIKFAKELLALYQERSKSKRRPYEKSEIEKNVWQNFEYELTQSQKSAILDIFQDMAKEEPMERLVAGEVGFGKTEVALRAALRAAFNNRQTAVLSPTTVLADQHTATFRKRLEKYGVEIKRLTRLETKKEILKTLKETAEGKVDILIGTHRLLSKDINFKNLGLLIIDEEQRFGVRHKETLKKKYPETDILYLSATPIPRTLYFSLSKIRPLSLISDAPKGRKSIRTFVMPRGDKIIKEALRAELERGGQIYFLSSRIRKMSFILDKLNKISRKTKKAVLHGRLSEKEIVKTMNNFREGKIKILVSTTIIENGLDISSVNTLIVEDATRLGLSQAHQLRGRIGRGREQAYAYFLYPSQKLAPRAQERLKALLEFQELGSGLEIAKRDLELRGAGNVLGKEQSGVMNKIGWNLYFQCLSRAIEELE